MAKTIYWIYTLGWHKFSKEFEIVGLDKGIVDLEQYNGNVIQILVTFHFSVVKSTN